MDGHLYLLVFASARSQYVKVGSTRHLDQRIAQLRTEARHFGHELRFAWATGACPQYRAWEQSVLAAHADHRHGDYLHGVDGRSVLETAREISAGTPELHPCPPGLRQIPAGDTDAHGHPLPLLLPQTSPGLSWVNTDRMKHVVREMPSASLAVLMYLATCDEEVATAPEAARHTGLHLDTVGRSMRALRSKRYIHQTHREGRTAFYRPAPWLFPK